jgi:uncharacterized protein (TIGR03086 family)
VIDLTPATDAVARVVADIRDDQLDRPTPCEGTTVAGLLDHLDGLAQAFVGTAGKAPLDAGPSADAAHLCAQWRQQIPVRLTGLAQAWQAPAAWTGTTAAGGVQLPGEVAGLVAVDEVVVHGWDLARATGQSFTVDGGLVEAALGPPVPVPDDATTARPPAGPDRTGSGVGGAALTAAPGPVAAPVRSRSRGPGLRLWQPVRPRRCSHRGGGGA